MYRRLLVVFLLTMASQAAEKPFVRLHWKGREIHIVYKGKTMTYDLGPRELFNRERPYRDGYPSPIGKVTTDYLREKNGVVYLLAAIEGNSRGPQAASSYCGAGSEYAKVLFTFDHEGEDKEPIFLLYDSCLFTIEPDSTEGVPKLAKRGKLLTQFRFFPWSKLNVDGKSGPELQTTVRAWFDPAHPENGIRTDEECAVKGASGEFDQRVPCPPN
jgi:hypothetical protein